MIRAIVTPSCELLGSRRKHCNICLVEVRSLLFIVHWQVLTSMARPTTIHRMRRGLIPDSVVHLFESAGAILDRITPRERRDAAEEE
jgi:hypothetical protein